LVPVRSEYMATSVTQSLFGITPESIMQERSAAANRQAMDFARLDPFEAARYGLFRGASQLGDVAASAMGYEDPEIARAKARQGMLSGVDLNNPESLLAKAQSLQATDPMAAQSLVAQANERQSTITAQQEAAAKREAEQRRLTSLAQVVQQKTGLGPEESLALAQDPAAVRELMKDDTAITDADGRVKLISKKTGDTIKDLGAAADKRSITNVNVSGTAENEYAKKVGAETATQDVTLINSVKNAPQSIKKLEETLDLIDKGQLNTGIASGLQDTIARARSKFLADKAAKVNVADSQYLDSLLGSDVFAQIQALGIGARGLDTPAEREFLLSVVTGTRALDKETLRRMTQFRLDAVRSSAEAYNDRIKNGELEQYQRITGRQLKPVELSSAKGGQQFPNAPPVGTVKNGFRYNGGDPAQPTSWSKK
jgi:hypothetical protein